MFTLTWLILQMLTKSHVLPRMRFYLIDKISNYLFEGVDINVLSLCDSLLDQGVLLLILQLTLLNLSWKLLRRLLNLFGIDLGFSDPYTLPVWIWSFLWLRMLDYWLDDCIRLFTLETLRFLVKLV